MRYHVNADVYEGPLPLLVELARYNLIDLFIIKLVDLTGQYLAQVSQEGQDLNDLAEPLPLLGTLIACKARNLMPQPTATDDEEEAPVSLEDLERRLKEYEQFKSVAQLLSELHQLAHKHFTRTRPAISEEVEVAAEPPGLGDVGIADLVGAFSKVLERATSSVYEVNVEPWTVEMKVKDLRVLLAVSRQISFFELFDPRKPRLELVVTFLALLELIRQRIARAVQEKAFDDIMIVFCSESVES